MTPKEEQKQNLIDMMQDDEKLGLYKQQTADMYRDWETDRKSTRLNSSHRL